MKFCKCGAPMGRGFTCPSCGDSNDGKAVVRKVRHRAWRAEADIIPGDYLSRYVAYFPSWNQAIQWALNPRPV